ncbi:CynX/NimT family MFS transporter [Tepidanaerobacter syntrophicus]|uniref:MFS transporter n=1 Tax=Tepidanaerobacter syntrophicus TaxID=224999 RepID=UPI001BD3CF1A|nr:MFS transporter [Tepidanaerobacter syntrophicus]
MDNKNKETISNYRWIVELFIVFGTAMMSALWLAPSPLLPTIIKDLSINLAQAGMIISIMPLCVALFSTLASFLIEKFGAKIAFAIALLLIGTGGALAILVTAYSNFLLTRLILGIGYAMMTAIPGVLIMTWFPDNEKPFINTINSCLTYVGMTLAFSLTLPLTYRFGSWQKALATYGFAAITLALLWLAFGREKVIETSERPNIEEKKHESALRSAIKKREVWYLAIALFGGMWEFQFFTTFLPTFYQQYRQLNAVAASSITSLITISGIIGGLVCGLLMSIIGKRKIFTWPLHTAILFGLLGSISFKPGIMLYISVILVGFGAAGWTPALLTIPMELNGMTPSMLGGAYAFIFGLGNAAAFLSPVVGGWLASRIGLNTTLFIFAFSQILPIVFTFLLPETGPRGIKK